MAGSPSHLQELLIIQGFQGMLQHPLYRLPLPCAVPSQILLFIAPMLPELCHQPPSQLDHHKAAVSEPRG
jgi:hypothetical protein